ncbi:MAG: hypothetical protein U9Q77_02860 [Candidatus Marinimicrobia bacterium]|nr:hypothetical protein [Candidatus Neomarinimicrobiota bacterium]
MNKKLLILLAFITLVATVSAGQNEEIKVPDNKYDRVAWLKYNNALERQNHMSKAAALSDRRSGTHNGNRVRTLFYNYGSIGKPNTEPSMEWPIGSGRGYAFEFGVIAGAKITTYGGEEDIVVSDGLTVAGVTYDNSGYENNPGDWQPLPGYHDPFQKSVAMSDANDDNRDGKPDSWPSSWYNPDFGNYMWPGEYGQGITTADQESYYVMDDFYIKSHNTYWPEQGWSDSLKDNEFYPDTTDYVRGGLGLEVESRGYQWIATRAQNVIFFVYELKNVGSDTLDNMYFGMYGDPHVGGASDYSDDDAYFDTYIDIVYGWDDDAVGDPVFGTTIPGFFGYKFLESPGEPRDGIDNDVDGMIDESMQDGIDNDGDWRPYSDWNLNGEWDRGEPVNDDLGADGVGPDDPQYVGADTDGSEANGFPDAGEPNFDEKDLDEADQIGLTGFIVNTYSNSTETEDYYYSSRLTASIDTAAFQQNKDNIFMYSSGPIKMAPNDVRRFSIAMLYGYNSNAATGEYLYQNPHNIRDLYATAAIMQEIYDAGYRFVKPPNKPRLTAIPGDGQVTLYWDEGAEHSRDPLYGNDFEGYAIYRATDFGFNESLVITDTYGSPYLWNPVAKFDLDNYLEGPHPIEQIKNSGLHYDMGANTGLVHSYVDKNLVNGQRYFYAICAYDSGSVNDTIPPTETAKTIQEDFTGNVILDVNTAVVTPQAPSIGYIAPEINNINADADLPGTGHIEFKIIDPTQIPDDRILAVRFKDSGMDEVDNDQDWQTYSDEIHYRNNGIYVDMIIPPSTDTLYYASSTIDTILVQAAVDSTFQHNDFSWRIKTWIDGPLGAKDTVIIFPDTILVEPTMDVWDPLVDGSVHDDVGADGCADEYEDGSGGCSDVIVAAAGDDPNSDNWDPVLNPAGTEANGIPNTGEPDLDMLDFDELIMQTQSFSVIDITDPNNEIVLIEDQTGIHGEDYNQISNGLQVFVVNDTLWVDQDQVSWVNGDCNWGPIASLFKTSAIQGLTMPLNYRLEFFDTIVDSTLSGRPMVFSLTDISTGEPLNIRTFHTDSTLGVSDQITPFHFITDDIANSVMGVDNMPTWKFNFQAPFKDVECLFPTEDGVMIGTATNGLAVYNQDSKGWRYWNKTNSGGGLVSNNAIIDIVYYEEHYWMATDEGPAIFDGSEWWPNHVLATIYDDWKADKMPTAEDPFSKNFAACVGLGVDDEGYLWMGSVNNGLVRLKTNNTYTTGYDDTIELYPGPDSLSEDLDELADADLMDLLVDGKMIWLATDEGVVSYNYQDTVWTHYPKDGVNGLLNDNINVIEKLPESLGGNLVLGTDKGLAFLVDSTFTVYLNSDSTIPDKKVYSLYYRNDNEFYVGTKKGFAVLDLSNASDDFTSGITFETFGADWGDSTIYSHKNIRDITFAGDYGYFGTEEGLEQRISKYEWNTFSPQPGDVLEMYTRKEFSSQDIYLYETSAAKEDAEKVVNQLEAVSVVPNPYVAAAIWERKPYLQSGRGERKIYFINLPMECTIRIYTMAGELVRKLEHNESVFNGAEPWDLLNLDNLEVAYGVYIYHIETDNAETIGKFAVIK